ncbi:uracil-DNA glycosylase family protein [Candidatus Leptofilum sp.]|uniref:uracil-DNA glycosylase family protein n=1 Tax=Candidatus Leptofilum sp. TaxID=3241576 RepID=UPI003B5B4405
MDSLTQLHKEMRTCRLCLDAGYAIVPGAVFRGSAGAEVLLIGQAPGVTEVEAKRPFNATSGTRLFQWLGEAGWDEAQFRARHYMTAVTKCYPGKGKNGKGDRVPSKAEQALCRPFLEREIALVRPKLMILVGGLAIKLLYPAKMKLNEVVGTAVYFPPETLTNPVNFNFEDALPVSVISHQPNLQSLIANLDRNGRLVVPLPHPSGASLWPNKPANKVLIAKAIQILHTVRSAWNL